MIEINTEQTNIISDTTAKPNNEETNSQESINSTINQLQCKLCTFKCRYKKSLNTHIKKTHIKKNHTNVIDKHNETNDTNTDDNTDYTEVTPASDNNSDSDSDIDNDYDEVTSAEEDNTPSTPDLTTNTSPNHNIPNYQTIMDWIDKNCIHHQKGTCKFGKQCYKKHTYITDIICPICGGLCETLGQFKYHITAKHDPTRKIKIHLRSQI